MPNIKNHTFGNLLLVHESRRTQLNFYAGKLTELKKKLTNRNSRSQEQNLGLKFNTFVKSNFDEISYRKVSNEHWRKSAFGMDIGPSELRVDAYYNCMVASRVTYTVFLHVKSLICKLSNLLVSLNMEMFFFFSFSFSLVYK